MFIIPSQSMENTLLVGDRVIVEKLTGFQRGDVVVFSDPGGWLEDDPADPAPWDKALEFVGLPTKEHARPSDQAGYRHAWRQGRLLHQQGPHHRQWLSPR
jgi:signal peptidase I